MPLSICTEGVWMERSVHPFISQELVFAKRVPLATISASAQPVAMHGPPVTKLWTGVEAEFSLWFLSFISWMAL